MCSSCTTATAWRAARSAPWSCSWPRCGAPGSPTRCSSAAPARSRAARRRARCCAAGATRTTSAPPPASSARTWSTCTTCCRCSGPRSLAAARDAGARVVLQLHNLRLFCAIGVAARDGGPCFRCHHRFTLPGLALNCRGSLPEAAVYAAALAPPSAGRAQGGRQLRRAEPLRGRAGRGARAAGRAGRARAALPPGVGLRAPLARRRGPARARRRAALAREGDRHRDRGVRPGGGAAADRRRGAASGPSSRRSPRGSGRRSSSSAGSTARRWGASSAAAAMLLLPSRYHEFAGYAALEAMAAGRAGGRLRAGRAARARRARRAACRRTTRRRSQCAWRSYGTARTFAAARATPFSLARTTATASGPTCARCSRSTAE